MRTRTVTMVLLCAVLALSCGGTQAPPDDGGHDILGDREYDDVPTRVAAAVKYLRGDTCFRDQDTSHCDWQDVVLDWKAFEPQKSKDAILIMDGFQEHLFLAELVRFRNRVKGLYRVSSDTSNQFDPQVPVVHVPRRLGEVLANLAGPGFVASSQLLDVASAVNEVYNRGVGGAFLGHGGAVFGHLVDLVPENPIVLVDMENVGYPPGVWCHSLDAAAVQKSRARFLALADSLRKIITDNNVHYINASFGATADKLADGWRRDCGDAAVPSTEELRAFFDTQKPFYEALFNTEGVVAAHAAIAIGDPVDFPFDQASSDFPNQVRTGFFSSRASGLDSEGRGSLVKVNQYPPNASDADVFLNWGCDQGPLGSRPGQCATPHFEMAGAFGLGVGTIAVMQPSWIAPLAVARLVNLKDSRHASENWSNELVARVKQELTPRACGPDGSSICQYQDPFAHAAEQLEVYRLGYKTP